VEGTTILIVEQNVKQTLLVADRGYVLETGKIIKQGTGNRCSMMSTSRQPTSAFNPF
jgi:ABC-type branched-subunit amino acid transport system ATPase component